MAELRRVLRSIGRKFPLKKKKKCGGHHHKKKDEKREGILIENPKTKEDIANILVEL